MTDAIRNISPIRTTGHLFLGAYFGLVLVKSEVVSWFRIQEMFRFDSFHMYGILGSAVVVAALSLYLIKRFNIKTIYGDEIVIADRPWQNRGARYWLGGTFFGLGWALLGACPGPIYALIGAGVSVIVVGLAAAVGGAWVYGTFQHKLPH